MIAQPHKPFGASAQLFPHRHPWPAHKRVARRRPAKASSVVLVIGVGECDRPSHPGGGRDQVGVYSLLFTAVGHIAHCIWSTMHASKASSYSEQPISTMDFFGAVEERRTFNQNQVRCPPGGFGFSQQSTPASNMW